MANFVLLIIGIVLITGLLFSKLAKKVKFPNVTGYLIGGLLIGPSLLSLIFGKESITEYQELIESLSIFSSIALGFIAFGIGANFKRSEFKRIGKKSLIIAIFESLMATLLVFIATFIYGLIVGSEKLGGSPLQFALILSAIAAATAPAATVLVIKQYKARGEVTQNLLAVVAIDDAVALIIYGLASSLARGSLISEGMNLFSYILPILEIVMSLALGTVLGIILALLIKWFTGRGNRLACAIAIILLAIGIQQILAKYTPFELSTLLICMMIGATLVNISPIFNPLSELVDRFTPPLYIIFFVLSGADLRLETLISVGLIGLIYIVVRVFGKYLGSFVGCKISKADANTTKYLGFCLIPQAGVALALSQLAVEMYKGTDFTIGIKIRTIILAATLIYELVGPFAVKLALTKAGEIKVDQQNTKNKNPEIQVTK